MEAPVLYSERLIYKPLSFAHLTDDYVQWLNDPEVYQYLESRGNYTIGMLEEYLSDVEKKPKLFWAIHTKENDIHIGNIKIDPVNTHHGLGEYGIMMGRKSEWGKKYAQEASLKIIDYCFNEIQLRKITLGVVADNKAAVYLYEKIGFRVEGIYKYHGKYGNKYCDMIRMAIFNPLFSYE